MHCDKSKAHHCASSLWLCSRQLWHHCFAPTRRASPQRTGDSSMNHSSHNGWTPCFVRSVTNNPKCPFKKKCQRKLHLGKVHHLIKGISFLETAFVETHCTQKPMKCGGISFKLDHVTVPMESFPVSIYFARARLN